MVSVIAAILFRNYYSTCSPCVHIRDHKVSDISAHRTSIRPELKLKLVSIFPVHAMFITHTSDFAAMLMSYRLISFTRAQQANSKCPIKILFRIKICNLMPQLGYGQNCDHTI